MTPEWVIHSQFADIIIRKIGSFTIDDLINDAISFMGETFKETGLNIFWGLVDNGLFIQTIDGRFELNERRFIV